MIVKVFVSVMWEVVGLYGFGLGRVIEFGICWGVYIVDLCVVWLR